ncbi:L,D-transpeptidase family protein [Actinosynnema sp. ALI-1.44]|uniref:L,D-transpeptidase family protein n=1 Tax=Actinosynnema sp. ALI-1.44 TaxID=1933779 RepID=UPI001EDC2D2B|nr:L,D-transpeptidase family protein [Actinosynnema sp. ALI-1.44]
MRRIALPFVFVLALLGVAAIPAFAPTASRTGKPVVDEHELTLVAMVKPGAASGFLPHNGDMEQMITVSAPDHSATTAKLSAWSLVNGEWKREIGPLNAFVGTAGMGATQEGISRTPTGVFGLTESFGIAPNNGTRLPYFKVDEQDWWVSDTAAREYNKHFRCAVGKCPFNERAGERLITAGAVYNHAVVIDYNRDPVRPGAGSAFFLHVSAGKPTAGCVSVDAAELDKIMRWLDPAKKPAINIG